ncbi:MAG: gliding motility-associated C-terminal domain-containing protein [Crocinitomicaceae bacterium]|nr:gliding motility-associated C-terminal domain-containing protein [Crocinitomicaceae bacterium]MCF8411249.1 gliding motility-associated C-terminal domain-containing protein [Crocinitomicaceae bacterium]MCF8444915.1 gliding motility-associated C-terminal domain-containing protein [Crocinitomicaceae bacterium]
MDGKDTIKELFKQKLADHQVAVNPELWSSIASKIPAVSSSVTTVGMSLVTKAIIGISVAASLVGIGYLVNENYSKPEINSIKTEKKKTTLKQIEKLNDESSSSFQSSGPPKADVTSKNTFTISTISSDILESKNKELVAETIEAEETHLNSNNSMAENSTILTPVIIQSEITNTENIESIENSTSNNSSLTIEPIQDIEIPKESSLVLILPNIFTPNGDGKNDFLELDASGIIDFSLVVLNERGTVIYQTQDSNFKWDGTQPNGDPIKEGNFVYFVTGKDSDGNLVSKHSRLVLKH